MNHIALFIVSPSYFFFPVVQLTQVDVAVCSLLCVLATWQTNLCSGLFHVDPLLLTTSLVSVFFMLCFVFSEFVGLGKIQAAFTQISVGFRC